MTRLPFQRTGLLAALLALGIQFGLAASVAAGGLTPGVPGVLCHSGPDSSPAPNAPAQSDACLACPLCMVLVGAMLVPGRAPPLLAPSVQILPRAPDRRIAPPPALASLAPQPRGPPQPDHALT
jgi:hypothetical protein